MTNRSLSILLLEDEEAHIELIRRALESEVANADLTVAKSVGEARCHITNSTPDLVIADLCLPDARGTELISTDSSEASLPVVIMISHGDEHAAVEAMKPGALDYIVKSGAMFTDILHIAERALRDWGYIIERQMAEAALQDANKNLEEMNKRLIENQNRLVQSEKMATIGQIAAGVAHEINNPVQFIICNLAALQDYLITFKSLIHHCISLAKAVELGDVDTQKEILSEVATINEEEEVDFILKDVDSLVSDSLGGSGRIREIVQNLKRFARSDDTQCENVDIIEGIQATLNIVWNELKYKCTVNKDLGPLLPISCNPGQINQVFMNILVNAAHAIPEKGEITIETEATDTDVIIRIRDNGVGIPEENIPKLFEPFFTTKEAGKGTGLGLAIAFDIIQKHNGTITVNSEVGKGTIFSINLPINGVDDGEKGRDSKGDHSNSDC